MVSKKEIATALKNSGLGFVKIDNGSYNGKTYKDYEGKSYKGIRGGSTGPMTMTNAHTEYTRKVLAKAMVSLRELQPDTLELPSNIKISLTQFDAYKAFQIAPDKVRVIGFQKQEFPTYSQSMDYDPSYETVWLIATTVDFGKKDLK